jgi:hypothetical protein
MENGNKPEIIFYLDNKFLDMNFSSNIFNMNNIHSNNSVFNINLKNLDNKFKLHIVFLIHTLVLLICVISLFLIIYQKM